MSWSITRLFTRVPYEYIEAFSQHRIQLIRSRIYLLAWATVAYFLELIILDWVAYRRGQSFDDGIGGYLMYTQVLLGLCLLTAVYTLTLWPRGTLQLSPKARIAYYANITLTCLYLFIRSLLVYKARQSIVFYFVSLIAAQIIFLTDWRPRLTISLVGLLSMLLLIYITPVANTDEKTIRLFECTGVTVMLFIASTYFYNTEVQMFLNLNVIQQQNQQLGTYAQLLEQEKQQREEELEQRSRELTSYTLQEVKYSRFLEEIRQQIQQESLPDIRRIPAQITTYLHGEDKWSYFKDVFENVHPQFFERITGEFPSLSSNDLRLMALLKMNLSTKEIADILGISPQSVNTARYRLRKRLNLKPEDDLESRIRNL
ncbi:hypothetical protein C5O19_14495 [Siphonobacter curvatus]|uniref:HTH luxR-type domain-containing protein n=1 Tax=Siphonobacter curvatus TaxID=2094562 RepID=A0A2S7ISS7_9BACT|nr:hypothetical protein C5O19_14495 [Siphonobacter curvatus]